MVSLRSEHHHGFLDTGHRRHHPGADRGGLNNGWAGSPSLPRHRRPDRPGRRAGGPGQPVPDDRRGAAPGGPADFPLVFRYQSDSRPNQRVRPELGIPFQRFIETLRRGPTSVKHVHADAGLQLRPGGDEQQVHTDTAGHEHTGSTTDGWIETSRTGSGTSTGAAGGMRTRPGCAGRWRGRRGDAGGHEVKSIVGPFGRRTTFAYDRSGMIRRVQDPGGRMCTFAVDGNQNLVRAVTPALCVTSFVYATGAARTR